MIRIAITAEAFAAIAAAVDAIAETLPLGTVAVEPALDEKGGPER